MSIVISLDKLGKSARYVGQMNLNLDCYYGGTVSFDTGLAQ